MGNDIIDRTQADKELQEAKQAAEAARPSMIWSFR